MIKDGTSNLSSHIISLRISAFLQTATKGEVIVYLPKKDNQFVEKRLLHWFIRFLASERGIK